MRPIQSSLAILALLFLGNDCNAQDIPQPLQVREELNNIAELREFFSECWANPEKQDGSLATFRFSVGKDGNLLGPPLLSGKQLSGDQRTQGDFLESTNIFFQKCFPVKLSDGFGKVVNRKPVVVTFMNKNVLEGTGLTTGLAFSISPIAKDASNVSIHPASNSKLALIEFSGAVAPRTLTRIIVAYQKILRSTPNARVFISLQSHGGLVGEDLIRVPNFIRKYGIGTVILPNAYCESACSVMFFAGYDGKAGKPDRIIYETARLGIHQPRRTDGQTQTLQEITAMNAAFQSLLAKIDVSNEISDLSIKTPPNQMHYLTKGELQRSNVHISGEMAEPSEPRTLPSKESVTENKGGYPDFRPFFRAQANNQ